MGCSEFVKCQQLKSDCFACKNHKCRILVNTTFTNSDGTERECPFYKKKGSKLP